MPIALQSAWFSGRWTSPKEISGAVVRFRGCVPDAELAACFRAADAFVLPAVEDAKGDVEGLGVVLIEALAHGLPVVASESGGIVDIVKHDRTGLLVPPGDAPALAAALRRLREEPALRQRLALEGRQHVAREFAWAPIIDRLVDVYRSLAPASTLA